MKRYYCVVENLTYNFDNNRLVPKVYIINDIF